MSKTFLLEIISPEKKVYSEEVLSLNVQTRSGEVTVLADHVPMISLLSTGKIKIKKINSEDGIEEHAVHGGSLEVKAHNAGVVILIDELIDIESFDGLDFDAEIKAAKERAKEAMENDDATFAVYEGEMEKYLYLNKILKNKK